MKSLLTDDRVNEKVSLVTNGLTINGLVPTYENSLDYVHAGQGRTNLHWRPHVARKTFSRQIQTVYPRIVPIPLQKMRTLPLQKRRTVSYLRTLLYRTAILDQLPITAQVTFTQNLDTEG